MAEKCRIPTYTLTWRHHLRRHHMLHRNGSAISTRQRKRRGHAKMWYYSFWPGHSTGKTRRWEVGYSRGHGMMDDIWRSHTKHGSHCSCYIVLSSHAREARRGEAKVRGRRREGGKTSRTRHRSCGREGEREREGKFQLAIFNSII